MNVILDTCALLALSRGTLPRRATVALQGAPEAFVSSVCAWEVAIKTAAGKLRLKVSPSHWFDGLVERHSLREVTLDSATACAAAALPPLHRDPFDRVVVALARARQLLVITSDENIPKYAGISTRW